MTCQYAQQASLWQTITFGMNIHTRKKKNQIHLPDFVITISVPLLWKSSQSSLASRWTLGSSSTSSSGSRVLRGLRWAAAVWCPNEEKWRPVSAAPSSWSMIGFPSAPGREREPLGGRARAGKKGGWWPSIALMANSGPRWGINGWYAILDPCMTGSLIRKFIQVQAPTVDDRSDLKQYSLSTTVMPAHKKSKRRQNKKRGKINLKFESFWKFPLQLCRNKHPLLFHKLLWNLYSRLLDLDQKSVKRNVKMFSINLQECCESDFPQSLKHIGHLCASRCLADISRIKPTRVSHLIDCSAFFLFCCCLQYRHSC